MLRKRSCRRVKEQSEQEEVPKKVTGRKRSKSEDVKKQSGKRSKLGSSNNVGSLLDTGEDTQMSKSSDEAKGRGRKRTKEVRSKDSAKSANSKRSKSSKGTRPSPKRRRSAASVGSTVVVNRRSRTQSKKNVSNDAESSNAATDPLSDESVDPNSSNGLAGGSPNSDAEENDKYCWKCHKLDIDIMCSSCPRRFHSKCLTRATQLNEDRVCSNCQEEAKNIGPLDDSDMDGEQFTKLLIMVIKKAYSVEDLTPNLFKWERTVNNKLIHIVDYRYIMDRAKNAEGDLKYKSHVQLLNDVQWMYHNTQIMHAGSPRHVKAAKLLLAEFQKEIDLLLNCKLCYMKENDQREPFFFIRPCENPHPLVWAKMRFHPLWPAKAYRVVNKKVCVRFFGSHEVSYVPVSDCYFLSETYPGPEKKGAQLKAAFDQLRDYLLIFETYYKRYPYQLNKTPYDHEEGEKIINSLSKQTNVVVTDSSSFHSSKHTYNEAGHSENKEGGNIISAKTEVNLGGPLPVIISNIHTGKDFFLPEQDDLSRSNAITALSTSDRNILDLGEDVVHFSDSSDQLSPQRGHGNSGEPSIRNTQNIGGSPTQFIQNDRQEDVLNIGDPSAQAANEDDDIIIITPEEYYMPECFDEDIRASPEYRQMAQYMKQDRMEAMRIKQFIRGSSTRLMISLFNMIFPFIQHVNTSNRMILQKNREISERRLKNADIAVKFMAHSKEKDNSHFKETIKDCEKKINELKYLLNEEKEAKEILRKQKELSDHEYEKHLKRIEEEKADDWCSHCKTEKAPIPCCTNGIKIFKFCSAECANDSNHPCPKVQQTPPQPILPPQPIMNFTEASSESTSIKQGTTYSVSVFQKSVTMSVVNAGGGD